MERQCSSKRNTRYPKTTTERQLLSAFLALPAEIRLVIYKLVVPYNHRIIPRDEMQRLIKAKSRLAKLQSMIPFKKLQDSQVLLRVHSLCYNEVAPLLYGSNQFYFRNLQGSFDWLGQIGPRNASMIRDLNLCIKVDHRYSDSCNERAMKNRFHRALQPMTGLRSLTLWHARFICINGVFTPRIASLRRARYLASQVPWLTRTYCHGTLLRFTRGEPDKGVSIPFAIPVLTLEMAKMGIGN